MTLIVLPRFHPKLWKGLSTCSFEQNQNYRHAVAKLGDEVVKHWKNREKISDERFVQALKQVFDSGTDRSASNSFEGLRTRVNELIFQYDPNRQATAADSIRKLLEIEEDTRDITPENHRSLVNEFITTLRARNSQGKNDQLYETARRLKLAYDNKQVETLGLLVG